MSPLRLDPDLVSYPAKFSHSQICPLAVVLAGCLHYTANFFSLGLDAFQTYASHSSVTPSRIRRDAGSGSGS
jgi:hypothetical protein